MLAGCFWGSIRRPARPPPDKIPERGVDTAGGFTYVPRLFVE